MPLGEACFQKRRFHTSRISIRIIPPYWLIYLVPFLLQFRFQAAWLTHLEFRPFVLDSWENSLPLNETLASLTEKGKVWNKQVYWKRGGFWQDWVVFKEPFRKEIRCTFSDWKRISRQSIEKCSRKKRSYGTTNPGCNGFNLVIVTRNFFTRLLSSEGKKKLDWKLKGGWWKLDHGCQPVEEYGCSIFSETLYRRGKSRYAC